MDVSWLLTGVLIGFFAGGLTWALLFAPGRGRDQ